MLLAASPQCCLREPIGPFPLSRSSSPGTAHNTSPDGVSPPSAAPPGSASAPRRPPAAFSPAQCRRPRRPARCSLAPEGWVFASFPGLFPAPERLLCAHRLPALTQVPQQCGLRGSPGPPPSHQPPRLVPPNERAVTPAKPDHLPLLPASCPREPRRPLAFPPLCGLSWRGKGGRGSLLRAAGTLAAAEGRPSGLGGVSQGTSAGWAPGLRPLPVPRSRRLEWVGWQGLGVRVAVRASGLQAGGR